MLTALVLAKPAVLRSLMPSLAGRLFVALGRTSGRRSEILLNKAHDPAELDEAELEGTLSVCCPGSSFGTGAVWIIAAEPFGSRPRGSLKPHTDSFSFEAAANLKGVCELTAVASSDSCEACGAFQTYAELGSPLASGRTS